MGLLISFLYPVSLFLILKYAGMQLDDMFVLKLLPLAISSYITFLIGLSYFKENVFIFRFAKKFSKKEISTQEKEYIQRSTLFWLGVSLVNVLIHLVVLLHVNPYYWVAYSSFGWYGVFAMGGVLQFLHRHFIFLKRVDHG